MKTTKKLILLSFLSLSSLAFTACNTIEGAGEDIEAAGDGIEDSAEDY